MKIKLHLVVILVIILFSTLNSYSQKKMVLHFKDGTSQTGYVTFKKKEIKFQEKLKEKKQKIEYASIDSIKNYVNPRAKKKRVPKTSFVYPTGDKNKDHRVYDLVKKGKVTLLKYSSQGGYRAMMIPTGGSGVGGVYIPTGGGGTTTVYAAKRSNEPGVTILNTKKVLKTYFEDCPILSEKIDNKEKGFTTKDVKKIIDYYNSMCK